MDNKKNERGGGVRGPRCTEIVPAGQAGAQLSACSLGLKTFR